MAESAPGPASPRAAKDWRRAALALGEVKLKDWRLIASRELPSGLVPGAILGVIGFTRIAVWQHLVLIALPSPAPWSAS